MGLLLLGGIQRQDLLRLPKARSRSLANLWRRTERTYFVGTTTRDLKAILHPFGKLIDTHVCRKEHIARALATLRQAGIAIINIENATMNHWVLAIGMVGVENRTGFQVSRLLVLDPSHGPIPLAAGMPRCRYGPTARTATAMKHPTAGNWYRSGPC